MGKRGVTLTVKEQKRLRLVVELDAGRVTGREAADVLGVSLRHVWRLLAAFREEGAAGLAHGNRGRQPMNKTPQALQEQILALAKVRYKDYYDTHFAEKLDELHSIQVSRSTLRRLRRSMGQGSPRQRRASKHRGRRKRYSQEGMLLQLDGSPHDGLEGRGPRLALLVAIDDATSEVPHALFREQEDDAGYFELIWAISQSHGLPMAVYTDRHTIFRSPKQATLEQQLAGQGPRSQFERVCDELAIEMIQAHSPQAKGRVERLLETLQDRLVKELREAQVTTREQANQLLVRFLPSFNARFSVHAAEPGSAYRPWPPHLQRQDVFSLKHHRKVKNDNTISFDGKPLQIPPGPDRLSYARATVEVQQRLDGSLAICLHDQTRVVFEPATPEPLRAGKFTPAEPFQSPQAQLHTPQLPARPRTAQKPAPDHPWRHLHLSPQQTRPPSKPIHTERQDQSASG